MKEKRYKTIKVIFLIIMICIIFYLICSIFGAGIIYIKASKNKETMSSLSITAFLFRDASDERTKEIGKELKNIEGINTVILKTREEAYNEVKNKFGEELTEGLDASPFSNHYVLTLKDNESYESIEESVKKVEGVRKVTSNYETIVTVTAIEKTMLTRMTILFALLLIAIIIMAVIIKVIFKNCKEE